ncbi:MAG: hypothetical protein CM1200mP3_01870 [Chloroflexota bacterium]|nr:MAG: hypothetical protein CM1200mP3_01870 [Chloroflexota bacterium]
MKKEDFQVEITLKGPKLTCFGTMERGKNAMFSLNKVIERLENYQPERDTTTSLFEYLSTFAIEHPPSPRNVDEIIEEQEEKNPRFASMLKALSRMTITPTMVSGGFKSNSVPNK